ncbi:tyrosine-type recombinase/integrase [Granulicella paludicola]|uniref:tyrosine-type recombinase/integrase n=1 Tax=Granulicella paludicola TaxID=474951 RepID=UPI0021E0EF01|nr:site-specific integrase [Granulicella paludicola]
MKATEPILTMAEKKVLQDQKASTLKLAELCDDLKKYIVRHKTQFKDQLNPPRRIDRIKADLGEISAASLKSKDVESWLDGLMNGHVQRGAGRPLADASVNRYRVTLSSIYKRGIKNEKVTDNPVRGTSQRKLKNGVIRWLRPEEEKAIRAAIQSRIDIASESGRADYANRQRHHLCEFVVSLQTGMRAGEQYGLTWSEVDLRAKQIHVRESKNGTERYIPMLPEVVAAFKTLKAMGLERKDRAEGQPNGSPDDSCFALSGYKKWWAAVLREAKIKKYRWHDNRHSFCSRLVQAGKSLKVVQELAGHRDVKMTARYAHLDQRSKREALEDAFASAAV